MNIRRNFEALFLAAAAMGLIGSYATANARPVEIVQSSAPEIDESTMQVIVVTAPRLSAAEKVAAEG